MKKLLLLVLIFSTLNVLSQEILHCGNDVVMKRFYQSHPQILKKRLEAEEKNKARKISRSQLVYTIPVVFHILHQGGLENISDAQAQDALRILNTDFAKQNTDTSNIIASFKSIAAATDIRFEFATIDPNGNCTNGIVHHYDADANWDDQSPTIFQYTWDPTMYMNVYVVKNITLSSGFSAAGYTYFPGTFSPGYPMDAIVVLNNYLGSIGTGDPFRSRVLTHEVGHWLNLLHIFGYNPVETDCNNDDYVNDTPTTMGFATCPDINDPSGYQLCSPGVDENFQNYMDYSYCEHMFTQGQADRMLMALFDNISGRDNLWTSANLTATGVPNAQTCAPFADFSYSRNVTCTGSPVTFHDASWNGQPNTYNWTFAGGNPSSSTSPDPVVTYNSPGLYSASLTVSNNFGTSAPVTKTNIINVVGSLNAYQNTWMEGFETSSFGWTTYNLGSGSNWEQSWDVAYTGTGSAKLPSLGNTRKAVTSMVSHAVNLTSMIFPVLTFKLAAAEINPLHSNTLKIYASTDCENTWTEIYSKTGNDLITTTNIITPPFMPLPSEWRSETVLLWNITGGNETKFRFTYIRDTLGGPTNVFVDDINITSTTALDENNNNYNISLSPNPASASSTLTFSLTEKSKVDIQLTDLSGKMIQQITEGQLLPGSHNFSIILNKNISAGIYLIKISVNDKTEVRKLVIH